MTAKRIIAFVLSLTMVFSLVSTITFAASDTYNVIDMSKKSTITAVGAKATSKEKRTSKYSAEWDMDKLGNLSFSDFKHDMSEYSEISFSVKLDSDNEATVLLLLTSENAATDGMDYYSKELTIQPGEWVDYKFSYSDLSVNRTPLGFKKIETLSLQGTGWNNKHADGAVMYVDGFKLSGEPTSMGGNVKDEGVKTFTEEDTEVGEKLFFNGKANGAEGLGNSKKTNIIETRTDSGDEKYIHFETLDSGSDSHLDMTIAEPKRFMIVEMKLAHQGTLMLGNLQYKDVNSKTVTVMNIKDDRSLVVAGDKIGSIAKKKGEFVDVALAFDFAKNTVSTYFNGEQVTKDVKFAADEFDAISMLRLYSYGGNQVGATLLVKDYMVYEGTELRDIPKDYLGPKVSKVVTNNDAAISALGKNVVAISVGGNGIYYNSEKHDIDAPAFIKDDRTLVPVRAISEAFGLAVDWDEATGTVTIDGKSKIVIGSNEMILPNGSKYTLDVTADTYNDRTFLPLRALCEQILGKVVTWNDKGLIVIGDTEFKATDNQITEVNNYLLYDRPTPEQIIEKFNTENQNVHPRVLMTPERYREIKEEYKTDPEIQKWGAEIITSANNYLRSQMPTYVLPDNYRLLATSRDVYGRAQTLAMAYILTEDTKYSDNLYEVFQAAGNFPDWNWQKHYLDVGEMVCAFAIGYDWLYDVWTDEQKAFLEDTIYNYGLIPAENAYYNRGNVSAWWTPGNNTNWNVVCNGGTATGAIAVFDKYPELCADLLHIGLRDVEAMMNSFYPDGAWFEGVGYWSYTLDYTMNMFSSLKACFNTDFNLMKAPGFAKTIFFAVAGSGPTGINNFHDTDEYRMNAPVYFWLSNEFDLPGVTNVRLFEMEQYSQSANVKDIVFYDTSIKGTDFELELDTYLRDVEFVAMRNSWVDPDGAFLSYHAGAANVNHSHLDTGSFVVDMLGERWAIDIGPDDYNIEGYFGSQRYNMYRMRPEGHNLYVINPDSTSAGQTTNHFCNVETLVSKPRGAYSIADLTPAYERDVTKARRGYMLGDDRRSAIIRDEITMKESGKEFYWFSHISASTEATIVDNNTVMLSKNGKDVKVIIDTNIPDYELKLMDATPLPDSPVVAGQNANVGIQKIAICGKAPSDTYVQVKFIPADDISADLPLENIKLDDWTIEDGEYTPAPIAPLLTNLSANGETVTNFVGSTTSYVVSMTYDETSVPTITAEAEEGCVIEIDQSQSPDEPTMVRVWRENEPRAVKKYIIAYNVLPKLEDINGYTRHQVKRHFASAEPEAAHPATLVSDNDTSPESRWAATNEAWLVLDLGKVQNVSAIGASWWKGDTRLYSFGIEISVDGENYTPVLVDKTNSGTTDQIEIFDFGQTYQARYVRYSGTGNNTNTWNSVTEIAALVK